MLGRDIVSLAWSKDRGRKDFAYIQIDLPTPVYQDRQSAGKEREAACKSAGESAMRAV